MFTRLETLRTIRTLTTHKTHWTVIFDQNQNFEEIFEILNTRKLSINKKKVQL